MRTDFHFSMYNFCIDSFFLFSFLQEADIIIATAKGGKIRVELRIGKRVYENILNMTLVNAQLQATELS